MLDFGINAKVINIIPGFIVTRYDVMLAPGVRIQMLFKIIDNIALGMHVPSVRIIPIYEKAVIGIEVPNLLSNRTVYLEEVLSTEKFKSAKSLLTIALGKQIDGNIYITDLSLMPHLLIAGSTGSGKSSTLHTIILSILYKAKPNEIKFILIDPKHVEMLMYNNISYLYNSINNSHTVITDPNEAVLSLKHLVSIMESRYMKFAKAMVRSIEDYNVKMRKHNKSNECYIVVVIDEIADLILTSHKQIEFYIQRLSQMARAVGIYLVISTQRPSVDVLTGVIKANFPARLALKTSSKIDSKVILDMCGAEQLLGNGDMLFLKPGNHSPIRLQGAYVSSQEIERIVSFILKQN